MNGANAGAYMPIVRIFLALLPLAGLLAAGCAGRADPPAGLDRPIPPVTLSSGAERSVCIRIQNDSGAQVELHSLLTSKIRSKNYAVMQDCGRAGYVLDMRVLEIHRGDNTEDPAPDEDFGGEGAPVLGLGVGSGMGGRGGMRVGAGLGLAFPISTQRSSLAFAYTYTMIVGLEIEESIPQARARQQTQLRVATPAPSEAAALPRLEAKMAEAVCALLP
jgi:hypothetical protein